MDLIEQITTVATGLGWQVDTDTPTPGIVVFEFSQYTPAGQDFNFSVDMKGDDPDSLLTEIERYYEGFDPDYEASLWIGDDGHGKNGAPYRLRAVLEDSEAIEKMVDALIKAIKKMEVPEEY